MRAKLINEEFLYEAGGAALKGLPKHWLGVLIGGQGSHGRGVGSASELETVNFPYTNNKFAAALKQEDTDAAGVIIRDGNNPLFLIIKDWEYETKFHVYNESGEMSQDAYRGGGRRRGPSRYQKNSWSLKDIKDFISTYIAGKESFGKTTDINIEVIKADPERFKKKSQRRQRFEDTKKGDKLMPFAYRWEDVGQETQPDYSGKPKKVPNQAQLDRKKKLIDKKVDKIHKDIDKELDDFVDTLVKNREYFKKEVLDDMKQGYTFNINAKEFLHHLTGTSDYGNKNKTKTFSFDNITKLAKLYDRIKDNDDPVKVAQILKDAGYK